jgi:hypothetical protein
MSDERSLLGTSLAAESSLFRHPGEVYFRATACFDLHSLYTRAFASFLESVNAARMSACATARVVQYQNMICSK